MKRTGALSFLPLLLFSGLPLSAQSPNHAGNTRTIVEAPPIAVGCPVVIRAQHVAGDSKTFLLGNGQSQEPAQQLHLILRNDKATQVVAVQVTVHGASAKVGMTQAAAGVPGSSEMTKTLNLQLAVNPKEEAAVDLSLRAFTSVQRVDLDSIDYADGTIWQSSSAQACRFVPEGFMPVASR